MLVVIALAIPLLFPLLLTGDLPGPFAAAQGDTYVFFEPYALEFMQALRNGSNPFWSHNSSFGSPTLLTLGTGALHPFHLFHLALPDAFAHVLGWWSRLIVCGGYLYLYLRQQNVASWIAAPFTLAFLSGGFNINYSSEIIGYVVAFFPMLLYYADKICNETEVKKGDLALLALATLLVILGGFLSVVLYLLMAAGVYILVRANSLKQVIFAAAACSVGVLLALPAIVETLLFYPQTGYDPAQRRWLYFYDPPAITALNLFIPSIFGNSADFRAAGMRDFFGSQLGAGTITVPVIAMGLLARVRHREPFSRVLMFWLATFAVCLVLYFNVWSIKVLLAQVPVIREHPFTRLQTLIALASAIAAAMLLDRCVKLALSKRLWVFNLAVLLAIAAAAYFIAFTFAAGAEVSNHLLVFGALTAVTVAALGWVVFNLSSWATGAFVLTMLVSGSATSLAFVPYFQPHGYYPQDRVIQAIKASLAPGARVLDVGNILFKGAAIAYGIPSMTNHWFSQPALRQWVQRLSPEKGSQGLTLDQLSSLDHVRAWPELRRMHVQFVVLPKAGIPPGFLQMPTTDWRRLDVGSDHMEVVEVLYGGMPLDKREGLSGEGYAHYREGGGHIRFSASTSEITLPVRHDPGWSTNTSGVALTRDDMNLMRLKLAPGVTNVHLAYWPASWRVSVIAAGLGVAVLMALLYLLQKKTRIKASHVRAGS